MNAHDFYQRNFDSPAEAAGEDIDRLLQASAAVREAMDTVAKLRDLSNFEAPLDDCHDTLDGALSNLSHDQAKAGEVYDAPRHPEDHDPGERGAGRVVL